MTQQAPAAESRSSYQIAFWLAVAITLAAWFVPYGQWAIYPFSMLATWAHEMGHGLTALLVGESFYKLEIFSSLGGLASTSRSSALANAMVSAGGLVGAPILGAVVVALGPRRVLARVILAVLAAALILSVVLWVRNPFGMVAVSVVGGALLLAAWRLKGYWRFVLVQFIGIQVALSALRGWRYLFTAQANVGGRSLPSDVSSIANALGGSYWMWGILLTAFNLAVLYFAYRLALRQMRR